MKTITVGQIEANQIKVGDYVAAMNGVRIRVIGVTKSSAGAIALSFRNSRKMLFKPGESVEVFREVYPACSLGYWFGV